MAEHGAISNVYFGFSPMWVATCILLVTYAVIISEKINRSIVALIGGGAMVLVGVINQEEALKGVDWNTIGLLTGMMILVSISRRSEMFQYLAIWSARAARAHPAGMRPNWHVNLCDWCVQTADVKPVQFQIDLFLHRGAQHQPARRREE